MAGTAQAAATKAHAQRSAWQSLKSADFAAALAAPVLAKSPHFVLHHLAASPASSAPWADKIVIQELSTVVAPNGSPDVDNFRPPRTRWLGLVVPKRHARRSVTRSLLKRQMRAQAVGHSPALAPGQWVIRLRAPFDPRRFPSAASLQLQAAAREELEKVFASVVTA